VCVWGTAKDITRQKQLEEESRLRAAVFEQVPDGCVIMEAASEKIVYLNPAFTEITGFTAANIPANMLSFLQGADTDLDTAAQIRTALAAQASFRGEILNYRKDGTPFWNLTRISPIRDSEGAVTHYAGILSDITAQKQSHEVLLGQRNQLAHVTRVATMGELTAALAHELNQPLTAILSNAQAALRFLDREAPDMDEVREILQDIVADDKRAGETMRSIRRLVKRDGSRFERLDVNQLVEEVHALTRHDLIMKQVKISTQLEPDMPVVQGDAVQLLQVILNLVMNACQVLQDMDEDERRIQIATKCLDNQVIEISVADSGPGIDEQMLEQIFEPFFTTKDDGLGMGLAINRTIIEAHRGRLWAENGTEQGAVFHVTLPVARVEQPA
jgi:PAS domain S-box-containing protein